jgi:hypothetical protein
VIANAKNVLVECEKQGTNASKIDFDEELLYDNDAVLKICPRTYKVNRSKEYVKCPFCQARYTPKSDGLVCSVCEVSKVGVECIGLKIHL